MSHPHSVGRGHAPTAPANPPPSRELLLSAAQALFAKYIKNAIPVATEAPPAIVPEQVTSVSPSTPAAEVSERLSATVRTLEQQLSRLTDENRQLREQLMKHASTEEQTQGEKRGLQQHNEHLQRELQKATEQLHMSTSAQSVLQQEYDRLASQKGAIEQELQQTKQQLAEAIAGGSNTQQLIEELQTKSHELGGLHHQLADVSQQKGDLERQHRQLQETLAETKAELAELKRSNERLTHEIHEQKRDFERSMVRLLPVSPILPIGGSGNTSMILRHIPSPPTPCADPQQHVQTLQEQIMLLQDALNLTRKTLEQQLKVASVHHMPSAVPPPPGLSSSSTPSSSAYPVTEFKPPALPFGTFDLIQAGRKVRQIKVKSWERHYLWPERVSSQGVRDPLHGLETYVRNWVSSKNPSQDMETKRRIFTWAKNYLGVVHLNLQGAISFSKTLETCPDEISSTEAKKLLSEAFVNPQQPKSLLSDDDDDWGSDNEDSHGPLTHDGGEQMDSMIESFNAEDFEASQLLVGPDQSIFNESVQPVAEDKMITKDILRFRFQSKIQQLDRTKAFVEDVLQKADLGKFGQLGGQRESTSL